MVQRRKYLQAGVLGYGDSLPARYRRFGVEGGDKRNALVRRVCADVEVDTI